ncbi:helix-turn-helix transcriptional regulator [Pseudomonas proteolytica]|uniref:helix-turn-helix transcriptional regulator n=1 Tax=Pseudomonas proteolytica TaxID=219574 RepID=UPI0021CCDAC5|nr:AlpA family transcriptional regulator [Pseudomonas proteolytica]
MNMTHAVDRFLRLAEVLHVTGLGRNTIYRRIRDGTFPRQIRLGPNSVAWRQSEINRWMLDLIPRDGDVAMAENQVEKTEAL